ncbi:MAG: hypothetical protein ABEK59_02385 [Halobacteria archaeon]
MLLLVFAMSFTGITNAGHVSEGSSGEPNVDPTGKVNGSSNPFNMTGEENTTILVLDRRDVDERSPENLFKNDDGTEGIETGSRWIWKDLEFRDGVAKSTLDIRFLNTTDPKVYVRNPVEGTVGYTWSVIGLKLLSVPVRGQFSYREVVSITSDPAVENLRTDRAGVKSREIVVGAELDGFLVRGDALNNTGNGSSRLFGDVVMNETDPDESDTLGQVSDESGLLEKYRGEPEVGGQGSVNVSNQNLRLQTAHGSNGLPGTVPEGWVLLQGVNTEEWGYRYDAVLDTALKDIRLGLVEGAGANYTVRFGMVSNIPPEPSIEIRPDKPVRDEPVVFDSSGSRDIDGSVENRIWTVNGARYRGSKLNLSFNESGYHNVSLTAVDDLGTAKTRNTRFYVNEPANVEVTGFNLTGRGRGPAPNVTLRVELRNTGDIPGNYSLEINNKGGKSQVKNGEVAGRSNKTVVFDYDYANTLLNITMQEEARKIFGFNQSELIERDRWNSSDIAGGVGGIGGQGGNGGGSSGGIGGGDANGGGGGGEVNRPEFEGINIDLSGNSRILVLIVMLSLVVLLTLMVVIAVARSGLLEGE